MRFQASPWHFPIAVFAGLRHKCAIPTKHLTGLDILVVEDELLLRKQIAAQLESLGADVAGVGAL